MPGAKVCRTRGPWVTSDTVFSRDLERITLLIYMSILSLKRRNIRVMTGGGTVSNSRVYGLFHLEFSQSKGIDPEMRKAINSSRAMTLIWL